MNIQQLYYAVAIAEAGTFSRAAERLYVAQPSLTNAIKELEREVGIRIFYRNGKGAAPTPEGVEFLTYARTVCSQFDVLRDRYAGEGTSVKRKFCVSAQHYSFAVRAFVDLVKEYGAREYEFAFRETETRRVVDDVARMKSEVGILFLSDFNRTALTRIFRTEGILFHPLTACSASVYLWRGHPLAGEASISFDQLKGYPCLAFEQGEGESFYFAEEILSTRDYPQIIRAADRATMLNLMVGLLGFTLCSGITCDDLNGTDFLTVPFRDDGENPNSVMEIGWISRDGAALTDIGEAYIARVKTVLGVRE